MEIPMRLKPVPFEPEVPESEHVRIGELRERGFLWHLDTRTDDEKAADAAEIAAHEAREDRRGAYMQYRHRMSFYNGVELPR
jgi:hypothetical protein